LLKDNKLLIENINLLRLDFSYIKNRNQFNIDTIVILPEYLIVPTKQCRYVIIVFYTDIIPAIELI